MTVTKTPDPDTIPAPSGPVKFTIEVKNASGSTSLTLTSLTDSMFGSLAGQGDCAVPQTIATGGSYICSFTANVSGPPGSTHTNTVTAAGQFPGTPPVAASDDATAAVDIIPPVPTLTFWWQVTLLLLLIGLGALLMRRRRVGG